MDRSVSIPDANHKDRGTLHALITEVAQNTGMHGVPNIQRSASWRRRIMWLCIVLLGVGMLIWKVIEAFIKYYQYPVNTQITFELNTIMTFPAITLCNMNPIRLSKLGELSEDGNEQELRQYLMTEMVEDAEVSNTSSVRSWEDSEKQTDYHDQEDEEFSFYETFMSYYMQLSKEDRISMGHTMYDMLLSCSFHGYKCSPRNFTKFGNAMYGNCFVFNLDGGLSANNVGPQNGLTLELYIEQIEYISALTDSAGIRISIHNQSDMPFPEDAGFSVSPGSKTSIGIKKTVVAKSAPPYGHCKTMSDEDNSRLNAYTHVLGANYTAEACKKTCYQKSLINKCQCFDVYYPSGPNITAFDDLELPKNLKPCTNPGASENMTSCMATVQHKHHSNKLNCSQQCLVPCDSTEYTVTSSTSMYPSSVAQNDVLEELLYQSDELFELLDDASEGYRKTFVKENVVKLEIYFEDLNYRVIKTDASYTSLSLLSDLGGQAGLWLGMSVIALFEVVELLIDLAGLIVVKVKGTKGDQGKQQNEYHGKSRVENHSNPTYDTSSAVKST